MEEIILTTDKVRPSLYNMEVGEVIAFAIEKMKNVRTTCSELGAMFNRKYSTHVVRDKRLIEVTRQV